MFIFSIKDLADGLLANKKLVKLDLSKNALGYAGIESEISTHTTPHTTRREREQREREREREQGEGWISYGLLCWVSMESEGSICSNFLVFTGLKAVLYNLAFSPSIRFFFFLLVLADQSSGFNSWFVLAVT